MTKRDDGLSRKNKQILIFLPTIISRYFIHFFFFCSFMIWNNFTEIVFILDFTGFCSFKFVLKVNENDVKMSKCS